MPLWRFGIWFWDPRSLNAHTFNISLLLKILAHWEYIFLKFNWDCLLSPLKDTLYDTIWHVWMTNTIALSLWGHYWLNLGSFEHKHYDTMVVCMLTMVATRKQTRRQLCSFDTLHQRVIDNLSRTGWEKGFHHSIQNGAQLKIHELYKSGILLDYFGIHKEMSHI